MAPHNAGALTCLTLLGTASMTLRGAAVLHSETFSCRGRIPPSSFRARNSVG